MKFIHLSDLHIHTHAGDNADAIATLKCIAEDYPDHRVIVTGDIADDGAEAQLQNALTLLQPFQGKVFFCPGNHDFGAAGNFYSHERAVRFDRLLAAPLEQGGTFTGDATPVVNVVRDGGREIMLIALDSNLETEQPFDFACGEIGASQLRALETIVTGPASAGMVKVVFLHHHPFVVNNPFMELKDAAAFARTVYGRIDVLLFGHKHEMKQWEGTWGIRYILASDNSPGKAFAKEITIDDAGIAVTAVPITGARGARRAGRRPGTRTRSASRAAKPKERRTAPGARARAVVRTL
jgi:3',5'-cyclic AMP phosphodiesterase CpdA